MFVSQNLELKKINEKDYAFNRLGRVNVYAGRPQHSWLMLYMLAVAGSDNYRLTEERLMESLSTDMHELCLKIDKKCR